MKKRKRILFAAVDVGFRIEIYTNFIKKHYSDQIEPESLVIYALPPEHYETNYTYQFNYHKRSVIYRWLRSMINFIFCLFRYDIFHFISGETLLTRKLRRFELKVYKLFGKRVIMQFVGADIRNPDYIRWKEKNIREFLNGTDNTLDALPWQLKLTRDAEQYADYILVSTPDLLSWISRGHYYPVMLDTGKFLDELQKVPEIEKKDEIVILHLPSNLTTAQKGTTYINQTLENIITAKKYNIRLIVPDQNKDRNQETNFPVTRYELFKHFKEADIVIDQMIIGWYGMQTVEAVAAGKTSICYVDDHLKPYLFPDCPVQIADVNTLEQVLMDCIENISKSKNPGREKQVEWVKKNHSIENNNTELLKAWDLSSEKS